MCCGWCGVFPSLTEIQANNATDPERERPSTLQPLNMPTLKVFLQTNKPTNLPTKKKHAECKRVLAIESLAQYYSLWNKCKFSTNIVQVLSYLVT